MASQKRSLYVRRRVLRLLEGGMVVGDRLLNQFVLWHERARPYNPLYHLGTLAIFLLLVLTFTGLILTIFYRPGMERAFVSVAGISTNWAGSLMRTIHRYAADALVLVVILHAVRMLFSDRFWGSRWLAWLSGWVMLGLVWLIGLMGYWLVWDESAQWLTTYFLQLFDGAFAYTFFGTNASSATFSLFVIVLFLHVFLPLLLVIGIVVHVLRLTRARYWAPRWLMVASSIALVVLAVLRPVAVGVPADLNSLRSSVTIDWWYLAFLPLAERAGEPLFWGIVLFFGAALVSLPWLRRGAHDGPAVVLPENCTGCGACARECPFEAIEMVQRDDETPYSSLAVVTDKLCTGCGICVGACPDRAIELDRLHSVVVRQDLQRTVAQAAARGEPPIAVFTCERHATLGSIPPLQEGHASDQATAAISIPVLQARLPPRTNVGVWQDSSGREHPVITCIVPCTGMLHPDWTAETIEAGSPGAIVMSCPGDDCSYREGPRWIANRLRRRRTLRRGNVHFLEAAPGSRRALLQLWSLMVGDSKQATQAQEAATVVGAHESVGAVSPWARLRYLAPGTLLLLLLLFVSSVWTLPANHSLPADGQIRLVMNHGGQLMAAADQLPAEVLEKLPPNVDPVQVLGGERFPVQLRLVVDSDTLLDRSYSASGLRSEGTVYAVESVWLGAGSHDVVVWLMDDGTNWEQVFAGEVRIPVDGVRELVFDRSGERFLLTAEARAAEGE